MSGSPRFLVLEDDPLVARSIAKWFADHGEVESVASVREAVQRLSEGRTFTAAILDVRLPDGTGLEVLSHIRSSGSALPVLMVTAHNDREFINRAQALRAEYVCKPFTVSNLRAFARRVLLRAPSGTDERVGRALAEVAEAYRLSPQETRVVGLAATGVHRASIATELGVKENTVKTLVRRLLKKTDAPNLDAVAKQVLQQALATLSQPTE
jgi:DNA-binding NarL/FixJ family response regulator